MTKARTLADFIADGSPLADGTISVSEVSGAAPLASPSFTGDISVAGNVDGRDVAADGTKLDTVETNADVTDATNVQAAGALMDSELTDVAAVKALDQGVSTTDDPTFTNAQLAAISSTIADTAVDIFVYDTRKDSDGGAWRKRTQHTSWYNETLNTSTRGGRKEFPAVAVIVAETNQVTIYDGDDPDLPMWMVFEDSGTTGTKIIWNGYVASITSVSMTNGLMVFGATGSSASYTGVYQVNLISEYVERIENTTQKRVWNTDIKDRNAGSYSSPMSASLVSPQTNDIAMTVLPNAPIDAATGLPVPTIAVATDGGVSVIKDDGTVVSGHTGVAAEHIMLHESGALVYGVTGAGNDNFSLHLDLGNTTRDTFYDARTNEGVYDTYLNEGSGECLFEGNEFDLALAQSKGLLRVAEQPDFSTGLHNRITSSYNTGWMNGDIKLATLSDTDATNVTGDITPDTANFYGVRGGSVSESSGTVTVTSGNTLSWNGATINVTGLEDGKQYIAQLTVTGGSFGTGGWYFGKTANADGSHSSLVWGNRDVSSMGTAEALQNGYTQFVMFTAAGTNDYLIVENNTAVTGETITFNNFSVRKVEEDRSVNGNGLQVFGTVTKSAVASNADLVAYSGFSTLANYLEQPYNSDLDFGTGDFCVMGWLKDATITDMALDRRSTSTSAGFYAYIDTDNTIRFATSDSGNNQSQTKSASSVLGSQWKHVCFVRTNSGTLQSVYVDGVLSNADTVTARNVTNTSATLTFGVWAQKDNYAFNGSLALWRISATAPSPDQIRKIYEDEKVLFQENAKATLYGSSDAVTALAYDDSTDLLHVGTSAGRSVFQGLRRVDNTTNAVGTAISASNSMVAED